MACARSVRDAGPQAWLLSCVAQPADGVQDARSPSSQAGWQGGSSRLHLQHGPIDLIISAEGEADEVQSAYRQAQQSFATILDRLAAQLPLLRRMLHPDSTANDFDGDVAQRMFMAARPFVSWQVTPMIAVAGAVADHVIEKMLAGRELDRVQVNNGGDIALYLAPGKSTRIGICPSPQSPAYQDVVTLKATSFVGGVATSGWQGRSHSLGIADAVTVLAHNAAAADAAATLVANAVDLPHSAKVQREPAQSLSVDSDLGQWPVTVAVQALSGAEKAAALESGMACARGLLQDGLLTAACLHLQGQSRVVGTLFHHRSFELAST